MRPRTGTKVVAGAAALCVLVWLLSGLRLEVAVQDTRMGNPDRAMSSRALALHLSVHRTSALADEHVCGGEDGGVRRAILTGDAKREAEAGISAEGHGR